MIACPSQRVLEEFLSGSLAAAERRGIHAHVEICSTCSSWLSEAREDEYLASEMRRALRGAEETLEDPQGLLRMGSQSALARYRILRRVGAGGMGVVFEAEQSSPRRRVALKVIRPGAATPQSLRRLEHEARILARLDHPGLARIIEAGSYDAGEGPQPFFAMEWIDGEPLFDHVSARDAGTRERLELFLEICAAIQHAHQKGVIHRDLKPANVHVRSDGRPVVLDFGVARASGDDVGTTLHTRVGQLVGTLAYMSPEQIRGLPDDLDTRSDIYALGVLLFELLTGRPPHDLKGQSIPEASRIIQETDAPRLGDVTRELRGDLEIVVAKTLEKDPARRYGSAAELAHDIERCLRHEPIAARAPSALYRVSRFARRHRVLVGAAAVIVLAGVAGLVVTTAEARRANAAEREATRKANQAGAINEFLIQFLETGDPAAGTRGPDYTVREALDSASTRLAALASEPAVEVAVRRTLGNAYRTLGQFDAAAKHFEIALDRARASFGPRDIELALSLAALGVMRNNQGRHAEAERLGREALDVYRAIGAERGTAAAAAMGIVASACLLAGRYESAEPALRDALALLTELNGEEHRGVATTTHQLAVLKWRQGRLDEAEPLLRRSLDLHRRVFGPEHLYTIAVTSTFAQMLSAFGKREESDALYRAAIDATQRTLGENHPTMANVLNAFAWSRQSQGDLDEAEELVRRALANRRAGNAGIAELATTIERLASVLRAKGELEESESSYREALAMRAQAQGADTLALATPGMELAELLSGIGRGSEAESLYREASRILGLYPGQELALEQCARALESLAAARGQARGPGALETQKTIEAATDPPP